jgi:hypothetical protein
MSNDAIPEGAEQPNVLHALTRKRAEIAGLIEQNRLSARRLMAELDHVDATIRIFNPDVDIGRIRAKTAPPSQRAVNGQVIAGVCDALRKATTPLSSEDIARRLMAGRGLDVENAELMKLMVNRVRPCLRTQRLQGLIRNAPHPSGLLGWELAP